MPGVVDQNVDLADFGGEPVDAGRILEVRLDEPGLAMRRR